MSTKNSNNDKSIVLQDERVSFSKPQVAVIAVTFHQGKFLLVQRANPPQQYEWGFPGGKVDAGESLFGAAIRELREETTIAGEALSTFDVIEVNEFDKDGQHYHFVMIAILCRYLSGEASPNDDAVACKWLSLNELIQQKELLSEKVLEVALKALKGESVYKISN